MEKRSISIFSFLRKEYPLSRLLINSLILFSFLFTPVGILCCGKEKRTEPGPKTNSPPVITSINISPEKPTKETELNLLIQSQDPDGDSVIYRYQWIRNDEEIIGENKSSLKSGNFKKGDMIRVRVTPSDAKVDGTPLLSGAVRILNSPPVIQEVWIEPKMAYATERLKVNVKSFDRDGDFVYYTYQWGKNGDPLNEERGEYLERGQFKKGDSIVVTVIPDDREVQGRSRKSEPLIISNSPPLIVSSPSISGGGSPYLYQVRATDPDDDPITFTLKSAPKGMVINRSTGLIRWDIQKEDKGNHLVEIEASDDAGAKSMQRYTLGVDFK